VSDPGITPGEAARSLGVAVTTLRTWHQRYGLGPSSYIVGQHRRYRRQDMAMLATMLALTSAGIPAARAARLALDGSIDPEGEATARAGGGNAIPVGRNRQTARGLGTAAMRLDARAMIDVLADSIGERGVIATWDDVIRPVFRGISHRQANSARLIDAEHLLSRSVSIVFGDVSASRSAGSPSVLLACADEEQHTLPLEALAASLAEAGTASRMLGARVPSTALVGTIARTGPAVVVVWSHRIETAAPLDLHECLSARPRPIALMAAGPGWDGVALPAGTVVPATLQEALRGALAVVSRR
jgi:DNA-binding transcriptional MerR regulator